MGVGPTRAEVMMDLIRVIDADYTKAVVKKRIMCPDCNGVGMTLGDTEAETDKVASCATCGGLGAVDSDEYDFGAIPENLRPFVTGFKTGPKGKLIPDMRNKDKAASELIKAITNGWSPFARDQFGGDAPAQSADGADSGEITKDGMIAAYQRIAETADPALAMNALEKIAKLKGWLTEDDDAADNAALTAADVKELMDQRLRANANAKMKDAAPQDDGEDVPDVVVPDDDQPA